MYGCVCVEEGVNKCCSFTFIKMMCVESVHVSVCVGGGVN